MELLFKGQFARDIDGHHRSVLKEVAAILRAIESANAIVEINQLKKLRQYKTLYRIKVADDYRIGLVVRGKKIWVVGFGHRFIFYKKFP